MRAEQPCPVCGEHLVQTPRVNACFTCDYSDYYPDCEPDCGLDAVTDAD